MPVGFKTRNISFTTASLSGTRLSTQFAYDHIRHIGSHGHAIDIALPELHIVETSFSAFPLGLAIMAGVKSMPITLPCIACSARAIKQSFAGAGPQVYYCIPFFDSWRTGWAIRIPSLNRASACNLAGGYSVRLIIL